MLTALFIRHGETGLNKDKRYRGFKDVPLNDEGVQVAQELGEKYGNSLDRIYSSDLQRASETANIISQGRVPVYQIKDLRPWDIGEFAGQKKTEQTRKELTAYADSGGAPPGGETIHEFGQRFRKALDVATHGGGRIAVVVHASNIHELGKMLHGDMDALDVKPGGVVKVTARSNAPVESEIVSRPNRAAETAIS